MGDYKCTTCSSGEIQRLSMVYEGGTSKVDTTTRGSSSGIGFAGGRVGVGSSVNSSRTRGTQMTELAKKAAPPSKKLAFMWIGIGLVAAIVVALFAGGFGIMTLLILGGSGYLAWLGFQHNANVYPGLKDAWTKSWLCHRCGAIFSL